MMTAEEATKISLSGHKTFAEATNARHRAFVYEAIKKAASEGLEYLSLRHGTCVTEDVKQELVANGFYIADYRMDYSQHIYWGETAIWARNQDMEISNQSKIEIVKSRQKWRQKIFPFDLKKLFNFDS